MLDRGFNPYVVDYTGSSIKWSYSSKCTSKSTFFSIEPFECFCDHKCGSDLSNPWFYENGVFDGQFIDVIGKGATGIVLQGVCHGVEAAFKFVELRDNGFYSGNIKDSIEELNKKLGEMKSLRKTNGSRIVRFYGHFR